MRNSFLREIVVANKYEARDGKIMPVTLYGIKLSTVLDIFREDTGKTIKVSLDLDGESASAKGIIFPIQKGNINNQVIVKSNDAGIEDGYEMYCMVYNKLLQANGYGIPENVEEELKKAGIKPLKVEYKEIDIPAYMKIKAEGIPFSSGTYSDTPLSEKEFIPEKNISEEKPEEKPEDKAENKTPEVKEEKQEDMYSLLGLNKPEGTVVQDDPYKNITDEELKSHVITSVKSWGKKTLGDILVEKSSGTIAWILDNDKVKLNEADKKVMKIWTQRHPTR